MAFMEFSVHDLSQQERGDLVSDDELWSHSRGYMCWFYRISHPIVNPLRSFLTTQLMLILVLSLPTRRLMLSSSGPDILRTHTRSSATSVPEWRVQWGFLMCFQILSLLALWMAYGPSIAFCRRCRFRGGGLGVIVHKTSRVFFLCFPDICTYLDVFMTLWQI